MQISYNESPRKKKVMFTLCRQGQSAPLTTIFEVSRKTSKDILIKDVRFMKSCATDALAFSIAELHLDLSSAHQSLNLSTEDCGN